MKAINVRGLMLLILLSVSHVLAVHKVAKIKLVVNGNHVHIAYGRLKSLLKPNLKSFKNLSNAQLQKYIPLVLKQFTQNNPLANLNLVKEPSFIEVYKSEHKIAFTRQNVQIEVASKSFLRQDPCAVDIASIVSCFVDLLLSLFGIMLPYTPTLNSYVQLVNDGMWANFGAPLLSLMIDSGSITKSAADLINACNIMFNVIISAIQEALSGLTPFQEFLAILSVGSSLMAFLLSDGAALVLALTVDFSDVMNIIQFVKSAENDCGGGSTATNTTTSP
jgi:hypothetical protein